MCRRGNRATLFGTDTSFILALPKIVGNLQNPLFRPVVFGSSIQSGTVLLLFSPTLILFGESFISAIFTGFG